MTLVKCLGGYQSIHHRPPVLASPISGKPFLFYVRAMDHCLHAMLAQKNDEGAKHAIYYLSRTLIGAKS